MATDLEKLVVQLSADIKGYERAMARAQGVSNKQFNAIERRARQMSSRLNAIGRNAASGLIAPLSGLGAALGVREIANYADAWTEAGNKIRAAGEIAGVTGRSLNGIKDIANETRSGFTETADLYAKLIRSASGVAKSELEIATATKVVNEAFKAGGASTQEQVAGVLQLAQALGSGLLQGDELRSIRENAPVLAQAIAKEFNTTIAGLKKLGAEGQITSARIFKAILAAEDEVGRAYGKTQATIHDALTQVNNEFLAYIGNANTASGASAKLVEALQALANNFEDVANVVVEFATVVGGALAGRALTGMVGSVGNAVVALGAFMAAIRTGAAASATFSAALGPIGLLVGGAAAAIYLFADSNTAAESAAKTHAQTVNELTYQIDNLDYSNSEAVASTRDKIQSDLQAARAALTRAEAERQLAKDIATDNLRPGLMGGPAMDPTAKADVVANDPLVKDRQALIGELNKQLVDLQKINQDFEDIASGKKKPTHNTIGFGGGSGLPAGSSAKKGRGAHAYENEIRQVKERTASTLAETEAMRQVNPLIDDYGFAVAKAGATQDLLNAAQRQGLEITPSLKETIDQLATGYATAEAQANRLSESQDKVRERAQEMRDLGRDALGGFISDLVHGKSAADALSDALGKIGDKLLDMALNSLFDKGGIFGGGGGGTGLLGGAIIPGILHSGGVAGSDGYGHGRSVSPGLFAGAPRYHSGGVAGLKPGEIPAILQRGEVVLPRGMKAAQSGGISVNFAPVIDARGADREGLARVQMQLNRMQHEMPAVAVQAVQKAKAGRVKGL